MRPPSVATLKTKMSLILATGIAIRELFSFWTGHPFDFELWVRTGYWVAHDVSPYGVLPSVPGLTFGFPFSSESESTIGYLTFWPLLLDGVYRLYALIGGGRFVYYFLIKQPIIAGDVLLGYFISRLVKEVRPGYENRVLAFWLFSPFTIIISGIWGMFDSLAMLPVVVALGDTRENVRSTLEGLAIWIKSIPVIYAVPFALSGKHKVRSLAISLAIPVLATLATVELAGWSTATFFATIDSTAGKGGQGLSAIGVFYYLTELNIIAPPSQFWMTLIGYAWIPALVTVTLLCYRWYGFADRRSLVQSLLLCTITFLLFKAQVNEQYGIYILALALVDLSWHPSRKWLYLGITAVDVFFLVVNNVFLIRFTAPIYPDWTTTEESVAHMLGPDTITRLEFAASVAFSALNAFYFALIYRARPRRPSKS